MGTLADQIEKYIKELLHKSSKGAVQINRSYLAQRFMCVPSQINYVLSTRFGIEHGYLVESRRGGGGYLRITKLSLSEYEEILDLVEGTPKMVSQNVGEGLIDRLQEEGFLTRREALLMSAVINRTTLPLELPDRDIVRGYIIQALLRTILRKEFTP